MRNRAILVFVLIAVTMTAWAGEETLDQLRERAASAKPQDQVKIYLQMAQLQLKDADSLYTAGDVDKAKVAVGEIAADCEKAGSAARTSGKHLKHAEIELRDLQRKLDAIRKTLSFEDRDEVQAVIDRLEKVRADLLFAMFGTKS